MGISFVDIYRIIIYDILMYSHRYVLPTLHLYKIQSFPPPLFYHIFTSSLLLLHPGAVASTFAISSLTKPTKTNKKTKMHTNLLLITALATSTLAVSVPRAVSSSSLIPDVQWKVSGFTRREFLSLLLILCFDFGRLMV